MGGELDQVLEALSGTVHHRANLKPFGFSQLVAQFETIGRGWFPGK